MTQLMDGKMVHRDKEKFLFLFLISLKQKAQNCPVEDWESYLEIKGIVTLGTSVS